MTVMQNNKKINKKIPRILPLPPKTEIDGKIIDLTSKTIVELLELRERQTKLKNNKSFISKLPDRGAKIQTFYDRIENVLKSKREEEQTCQLFENLKLRSVQNVEWDGNVDNKKSADLDSDDDSEPEDVMHILSQRTAQEKKVKVLQPNKHLITAEDLINIGEWPHVKYIVDKTEHNTHIKATGHFKPFKTTMSDVHNPEKEILRKRHKNWEVTAATPPPIVHSPAKVLTIEESLKLQREHNIHLKEVEVKHAAEKLLLQSGIRMEEMPTYTAHFGKYREADSDDSEASDPEGSDKEIHDEEPDRGGVVFTVMK